MHYQHATPVQPSSFELAAHHWSWPKHFPALHELLSRDTASALLPERPKQWMNLHHFPSLGLELFHLPFRLSTPPPPSANCQQQPILCLATRWTPWLLPTYPVLASHGLNGLFRSSYP